MEKVEKEPDINVEKESQVEQVSKLSNNQYIDQLPVARRAFKWFYISGIWIYTLLTLVLLTICLSKNIGLKNAGVISMIIISALFWFGAALTVVCGKLSQTLRGKARFLAKIEFWAALIVKYGVDAFTFYLLISSLLNNGIQPFSFVLQFGLPLIYHTILYLVAFFAAIEDWIGGNRVRIVAITTRQIIEILSDTQFSDNKENEILPVYADEFEENENVLYLWLPQFSPSFHIGHISLKISKGTYVSHWPKKTKKTRFFEKVANFGKPSKNKTTLKRDIKAEGRKPDMRLKIPAGVLDELTVEKWWADFKASDEKNQYHFLQQNCADVVAVAVATGLAFTANEEEKIEIQRKNQRILPAFDTWDDEIWRLLRVATPEEIFNEVRECVRLYNQVRRVDYEIYQRIQKLI